MVQAPLAVPSHQPDRAEKTNDWLARFHAGDREILASCYSDHYQTVEMALRDMLEPADRENVIHDLFFSLINDARARASFQGGALGAFLRAAARNRAIDYLRQRRRHQELNAALAEHFVGKQPPVTEDRADARTFLLEFQRQHLPTKWAAVFEARFLKQLPQRDAARELGISRTTLAYQEQRIRWLLRKKVLRKKESIRHGRS